MTSAELWDLLVQSLQGPAGGLSPAGVRAIDELAVVLEARFESAKNAARNESDLRCDREWVDAVKKAVSDTKVRGEIFASLNMLRIVNDRATLNSTVRPR